MNLHDYVMRYGVAYRPNMHLLAGEPGQCFRNAQRIARACNLDYIEGYAEIPYNSGVSIDWHAGDIVRHAWVAKGIDAYEVTWHCPAAWYVGIRCDLPDFTAFRIYRPLLNEDEDYG